MFVKDMPLIVGVDKIYVYQDGALRASFWVNGASIGRCFREEEVLKPFANYLIDSLEMGIEGCLSEIIVCEIYLK